LHNSKRGIADCGLLDVPFKIERAAAMPFFVMDETTAAQGVRSTAATLISLSALLN
jgi:hypothetical protein